jgi:hypothetical protein|tara:strand:+ start:128 stop:310 length:183 start_codon:yes stop_codon:yes gene_type:complete
MLNLVELYIEHTFSPHRVLLLYLLPETYLQILITLSSQAVAEAAVAVTTVVAEAAVVLAE